MKYFPPPQEKESLSLLESECTYSSEAHINTNKDDVHQQDRKNRAGAGEITQFHVMLTTVRFLPWRRCSILVHSEDTHGNPPALLPPALQLLPADPPHGKVYIHNAALPPCLWTSLRPPPLSSLCQKPSPSPRCFCPVSLNVATCADSPLSSLFTLQTLSLCASSH